MQYNNDTVRRQDHLLDELSAKQLLEQGEYGVLSMVSENNTAYGIPMNFVWDGRYSIYLHCALEGKKLRSIVHNKHVSFCITGSTKVVSHKFTCTYESIVLQCIAHIQLENEERIKALELFLHKYSPQEKKTGMKLIKETYIRTEIIRLEISEWSGKTKA